MRVDLVIGLELADDTGDDALGAIRETAAEAVVDSHGDVVRVVAQETRRMGAPFTVLGTIRGKPAESWRAELYAGSAEEAKAIAIEADDKRAVAAVLDGHIPLSEGAKP